MRRDFLLDFGFGFIALIKARCCRCIAVAAALVHHPITALAQVSMMLLGLPRIYLSMNQGQLRTATSDPAQSCWTDPGARR